MKGNIYASYAKILRLVFEKIGLLCNLPKSVPNQNVKIMKIVFRFEKSPPRSYHRHVQARHDRLQNEAVLRFSSSAAVEQPELKVVKKFKFCVWGAGTTHTHTPTRSQGDQRSLWKNRPKCSPTNVMTKLRPINKVAQKCGLVLWFWSNFWIYNNSGVEESYSIV
jgi:hypothetical protein